MEITRYLQAKKERLADRYGSEIAESWLALTSLKRFVATQWEAFGRLQSLCCWADEYDIDRSILYQRIDRGMDLESALLMPVGTKKYKAFGEKKTITQWADKYHIKAFTLGSRLRKGIDLETALTMKNGSMIFKPKHPKYRAFGREQTLAEWADEYGIKAATLWARMNRHGLNLGEALTIPLGKIMVSSAPKYEAFGKEQTMKEWGKQYGINPSTLYARMNRLGMSLDAALTMKKHSGKQYVAKKYKAFGKSQTLRQWANEYGIKRRTLCYRMQQGGHCLESALTMKFGATKKGGRVGSAKRYEAFGKKKRLSVWAEEYGIGTSALWKRVERKGMSMEAALDMGKPT